MEQSFAQLAEKYLTDELGPAEVVHFCERLQEEGNRLLLADMIDDRLQSGELGKSQEHTLRDLNFIKIRERLRAGDIIAPVKRVPFLRTAWVRYAAAILLFLAGGAYLWYYLSSDTISTQREISEVITPGSNKATLMLADGSTIMLDNTATGDVAKQGNTRIYKQDSGWLRYDAAVPAANETMNNTVTTPYGGQYGIVLPDGSKLWLNAGSSVKFPTAFNGDDRRVQITGEAYLEIKPDAKRPFYASVNGMEVQVLGTAFNVNAYAGAKFMTVTLIQGSVQVNAFRQFRLLMPGEQAVVSVIGTKDTSQSRKIADLIRVSPVSVGNILAWKNGFFIFDNVSLEEAMMQIARWYDVEVVYERGVPDMRFSGRMQRTSSLYDVLHVLEGMGIEYRMEPGRKVVLYPWSAH